MNRDEFNKWWRDYAERFPSTAKWIKSLDEAGTRAMLLNWSAVLTPVELADALQINASMAAGELEPVGTYDSDRERTAATVRRAALHRSRSLATAKAFGSSTAEERPMRSQRPRGGDCKPLSALVGEYARLLASGRTKDEAWRDAGLSSRFIEDEPPSRGLSNCRDCHDSGLVEVWHIRTIRAWRKAPELLEHAVNRLSMSLPCDCPHGLRLLGEPNAYQPPNWHGWHHDAPRYHPLKFLQVIGGDLSSDDALARLAEFCSQFWSRVSTGEKCDE